MNQAYESASFVRCVVPETADIQAASAAVAANPESGDAWMKKGHALAKVSMMREAEECYAMAISCDPFNWEYYRHRAHRFLSCWRFEDAAADFVIASRLNPNDWNVFYHLGLSYFLLRDYAKAAKAYARCYELTDADPELIAVTDWYYMTLKRLGNDEEAAKILARITDHMNPGENTAYYARLLMYKGLKKPEELLSADPEEVTALELITMGFGIANYFLQNGQPDKAYDLMERVVKAGDAVFELGYKEALYLGSGDREVTFASKDAGNPAKFYFNSLTAHRNYPDKKVTKADAVVAHMGSLEGSNDRNINKMLVNQVLPTCQLQMGMTELLPGSVWNTMPAHVHSRRMEAYFYFEVPEDQAVCHFMGEVDETRHIWMKGDQAVLSPEWSIHSAAATHNYTFIWGMGGENLDYGDQDFSKITDLK